MKWLKNSLTGEWLSSDGRWSVTPAYEPSIFGGSVTRPSYWVAKDTAGAVAPFQYRYLSDVKSACKGYGSRR